jgi:hypothetical protein
MTQTMTRKAETGEPTANGGHFGSRRRTEAEDSMLVSTPVPDGVETNWPELETFEFDGETLHVTAGGEDSYQVWSPSAAVMFYGAEYTYFGDKLEAKRSPSFIRGRAIREYAEHRAHEVRERVGFMPALDAALVAEAERLDGLAKNARVIARAKRPAAPKHPTLI